MVFWRLFFAVFFLASLSSAMQAWGQILRPPEGTPLLTDPEIRPSPSAGDEDIIRDIVIEGSLRTDPESLLLLLPFRIGDPFDPVQQDKGLKALFATGYFRDVRFARIGSEIRIRVEENAVINRIAFEGNRALADTILESEISLRTGQVLTASRVQSDIQRILTLYRRRGRFSARVDPRVIRLEQNRANLVFEITEGRRTRIREIVFIGNRDYSDGRLYNEILSRETRFFRLLDAPERWDPDRIAVDVELLRRFYLERGYIDIRIEQTLVELAPDRQGFALHFLINEGRRYQQGIVKLDTPETLEVDAEIFEEILDLLRRQTGKWANILDANEYQNLLTDALARQGYYFVDVNFQIDRLTEPDPPQANFQFKLTPVPARYVERIEFNGNNLTLERILRQEFLMAEGDPFNANLLARSLTRLRNTGFFRSVQHTTGTGSSPNQIIISVDVEEAPTGSINFGVGYSTIDGGLVQAGYGERNFRGRGQRISFETDLARYSQSAALSFLEPRWLHRRLSYGYSLSFRNRDLPELTYSSNASSLSGNIGYRFSEYWSHRIVLGYTQTKLFDIDAIASPYTREREGVRDEIFISQTFRYDRRDNPRNPRRGFLVSFSPKYGGFTGHVDYAQLTARAGVYFPLTERINLRFIGRGGVVESLSLPLTVTERFLIGGNSLRGFAFAGIGPRDITRDETLGGERYYTGSAELIFPIGLPQEAQINGFAFVDAGSLTGISEPPLEGGEIVDSGSLRIGYGYGIQWDTPVGPLRFEFSKAYRREDYDDIEGFRFRFGTVL